MRVIVPGSGQTINSIDFYNDYKKIKDKIKAKNTLLVEDFILRIDHNGNIKQSRFRFLDTKKEYNVIYLPNKKVYKIECSRNNGLRYRKKLLIAEELFKGLDNIKYTFDNIDFKNNFNKESNMLLSGGYENLVKINGNYSSSFLISKQNIIRIKESIFFSRIFLITAHVNNHIIAKYMFVLEE